MQFGKTSSRTEAQELFGKPAPAWNLTSDCSVGQEPYTAAMESFSLTALRAEIKKPNLPFAGIKRHFKFHSVGDAGFVKGGLHTKKS